MKKKLLATLLVATMAVSLVACGGTESASDASSETTETTIDEPKKAEVTIDEQEIFNQNDIVVTVTGFKENGDMGPEINVLVENNGTQNVTVQAHYTMINGYMVDNMFSCDVAAGKKANDSICFMSTTLEDCGIDTVGEIEIILYLLDTDTWNEITKSDIITINTSASGTFTQNYDDGGNVLFESNGVRVIYKELRDNEFYGPELVLYIENSSDQNVVVQSRETSVNGFMVEPFFSSEVFAGKKAISAFTFFSDELDANGITSIDSLETTFVIIDGNTWADIQSSDVITITP